MAASTVKLQIKNPNGHKEALVEVEASALVGTLKEQLQREYPGNPSPEDQKLIYCGQLLHNSTQISSVFKNANLAEVQTFHIVVKPSQSPPPVPPAASVEAPALAAAATLESVEPANDGPSSSATPEPQATTAQPLTPTATSNQTDNSTESAAEPAPAPTPVVPRAHTEMLHQPLPPFHSSVPPVSPAMYLPLSSPFVMSPPSPVMQPNTPESAVSQASGARSMPSPQPMYLMNPLANAMALNSALITLQHAHIQRAAMMYGSPPQGVPAPRGGADGPGTSDTPSSMPSMPQSGPQQGAGEGSGTSSAPTGNRQPFPMFHAPGTPPFSPILPYPMPMGSPLPYPYPMPFVQASQPMHAYGMHVNHPPVSPTTQQPVTPGPPDPSSAAMYPPPTPVLRRRRVEEPAPAAEAPAEEAQAPEGARPAREARGRRARMIRIDIRLALKLIFMVAILNQDGSNVKLVLMSLAALFVYLFQTGALDALQRRLNPPHVRPQVSGQQDSQGSEQERGQDGTGEGNHPQQQHLAQPAAQSPPTTGFMAFAMEVQTIVLGFVTSLLPGWHNDGPQVQPVRQGGVAGVADLRAQGVDDN